MGLVKSAAELMEDARFGEKYLTPEQRKKRHGAFIDEIIDNGREKHPMLLTIGEAAHGCKVSRKTIDQWVKRGWLDFRRTPGGHRRFDPEDVEAAYERWKNFTRKE